MDPFMDDEEESYFDEDIERELAMLLKGNQRDMRCPVCNVDTKKGERFHGIHSLLQHSQTKKTKNQAENIGHRDQAKFIKEFQKKVSSSKQAEEGEIENHSHRYSRNGVGSKDWRSKEVSKKLQDENLSCGSRREREVVSYNDDVIMSDAEHVAKKPTGNCAFPKNSEMEVWPPVIIFQGIQVVKQSEEGLWQPLDFGKDRLSEIIEQELGFSQEYVKSVRIIYGRNGLQIDPDVPIVRKKEQLYGSGTAALQLTEKAYYKLVDFNERMSSSQRGREAWKEFIRTTWSRVCSRGDHLPSQNSMIFAYQATPADVEYHLKEYKKYIVKKDKFRGDPQRLQQKLEEETRQKLQQKAAMANLESNFSNKLQEKTIECLDLKQVLQEREEFHKQKEEVFKTRELEVLKSQTQQEELQKQLELQKSQVEEQTKMFQNRIAEMQRQSNSLISTHEVQVGHLTSKLQILQLENKEDLKKKRQLEQCYSELQQKELEMQMMQEKVKSIELEMKDKELQNLKAQQELQKLESELEQEGNKGDQQERINETLTTLGLNITVEELTKIKLNCQTCLEQFVPYQYEPKWGNLPETRYDIAERERQKEKWKETVRARFSVKLDCQFGCFGVCMECAERLWKLQGQKIAKSKKKTRECPYCKAPWRTPPKPLIVNFRI